MTDQQPVTQIAMQRRDAGPSRRASAPKPRKSWPSSPAARQSQPRRSSSPPPRRQATEPPVSAEEKALWQTVLASLPPRATCEILLEYLFSECDWLWDCGDVLAIWHKAISTGGIDSISAGMIYASLAVPYSLLDAEPSALYRPPLRKGEADRLFDLAIQSLPVTPTSIGAIDALLGCIIYLVYAGQGLQIKQLTVPAMEFAMKLGMFDESSESWRDLDHAQRNDWRRVAWSLYTACRWTHMYGQEDPVPHLRLNLCRPDMTARNLSSPVNLDLPYRAGEYDYCFRIIRVRSKDELSRIARYRHLMLDTLELIPRTVAFQRRIGFVDPEVLLGECEIIYRDIQFWLEYKLPSEQFDTPAPSDIDPTSIVSCRYASQALLLNLAVTHVAANLLRHWLEFGDIGPSSPSPQRRMYTACLENAKRTMDMIPTIRVLMDAKHGPMAVAFTAMNLFNAATSYAIPVLRAVRYWTSRDTQADISSLPIWPDPDPRNPPAMQRDSGRLPLSIYTDSTVKECATNILVILDALSGLRANPLGHMAERRLGALIAQYGLRDAASVAESYPYLYDPANDPTIREGVFGPTAGLSAVAMQQGQQVLSASQGQQPPQVQQAQPPQQNQHGQGPGPGPIASRAPTTASSSAHTPALLTPGPNTVPDVTPVLPYPSAGIPSGIGPDRQEYHHTTVGPNLIAGMGGLGEGGESTDDFTFLSSLLQMDESIWEGLLDMGATAPSNGQMA